MQILNLAKILIKNENGKYLILRSGEWLENPKRSLQPDLPGGEVEAGETPEQGVLRELYEEAGVVIEESDLQLVYKSPEVHGDKHPQRYVYFAEVKNPEITLSWEHDKYWWMGADEILSMGIREPYPEVFKIMADKGLLV